MNGKCTFSFFPTISTTLPDKNIIEGTSEPFSFSLPEHIADNFYSLYIKLANSAIQTRIEFDVAQSEDTIKVKTLEKEIPELKEKLKKLNQEYQEKATLSKKLLKFIETQSEKALEEKKKQMENEMNLEQTPTRKRVITNVLDEEDEEDEHESKRKKTD
jgi:hypothetical protein